MAKRAKIIVSDTEPQIEWVEVEGQPPILGGFAGVDVGFLWFKPGANPKFYQVTAIDPVTKMLTWGEVLYGGNMSDINFTGTVSVNGDVGVTGARTLGGYTITFKNGILTGFAPV